MVKRMISRFSVLAVLIACITACSKSTEYTNVIPAESSALASINLKSLAEKAGLNDKENEAMKQKMLDAFKSGMTAATFQQLEKIIKNPTESGIEVKSPVYIFTSPTFPYATLVAQVNNEDNLKASLDVMVKEQICQPVADADGYKYTSMNGSLFVFNSSTAMLVQTSGDTQTEEVKKMITDLMKQPAEKSIIKSNRYQQMLKQKGDISFFASMSALPSNYIHQINVGLPNDVNLQDLTVIGSLSFEKGRIVAKLENYTENPEVKALLAKQTKAVKKVNDTFLKYFPSSTLAFLNIGINGGELYNILLENEDFRQTVSVAKAAEVKELFSSFDGDISIGLINVTMNNAPTFVAYANVKNGKALEAIYKNKQNLGLSNKYDIIELGKEEYVLKGIGTNIFFGIKNNQMYATNDELIYKNIDKANDKSIKEAPFASEMKGKNVYTAINMEAILDLPVVKMLAGFGGEEVQMYTNLASQIAYFSASQEGETNQMELVLKNKDVNALKQIVDFAKQFTGM